MFINRISNFINIYSADKCKTAGSIKNGTNPMIISSNLVPLTCDTVSFTGAGKLRGADMAFAPSEALCHKVEENAEPARYYLECVLDKYVGSMFERSNGEKPPVTYSTRVKKAKSIREKVISRYMKRYHDDVSLLSKQIVDEFAKYYEISDKYNKTVVENVINKYIISLNKPNEKISPYNFVDYFVNKALEHINKYNMMNVKEFSPKEQESIKNRVVDSINESEASEESLKKLYLKTQTISGVKYYANDVVGGRIILHDGSRKYTNALFDGLMRAVEDKKLKIVSIENNLPDPDKLPEDKRATEYSYAKNSVLKKLADLSGAEYIVNKSTSGYLSIHINIDLSNDLLKEYGGVYNGYLGEIQILGADVERLKDVEDLCYKFKDDKNSVNEAYKPFKDVFTTYYTGRVCELFDDYTYALYLHQREIEPGMINYTQFPSLEKLGFQDKIPPELDFNNLARIKKECDIDYAFQNEEENADLTARDSSTGIKKSIKKQGDIETLKKMISYDVK